MAVEIVVVEVVQAAVIINDVPVVVFSLSGCYSRFIALEQ